MKAYIHLAQYLAQYISEWEIFQLKVVVTIETHNFMFSNFFENSVVFWDNVEKYGTAVQDTDDNIIRRMRTAWWISKATNTHLGYVIFLRVNGNNGCMNTPQYYVIRTLHVLLLLNSSYIHSPLGLRGLCIHLNQDEGQWIITHITMAVFGLVTSSIGPNWLRVQSSGGHLF
jgi:hypothetical protein